ncbi:nucleotidyltransferase family protein [Winogradskya humida]|uniref:4-diphosphocytidyl-2C-methyl-D-erythritol synthase n=1 Tax=Winogradskya humida TaxID=113566 RepID=A0ABQ3ZTL7_9ACTN|nr:nucleotidyltransferase family protein [Actinoplanes humidus]GIE21894.1 4-diphosphocytidyl-2C-methyl-D-erythritol synthase [Actinoplanes humidus]
MKVAGLVLAAGAGRRYGMPKALVPWEGTLLVRRAERTLRTAGLDRIHIVVGAQAERVRAAVPGVDFVDNPEWDTGMASSLRAGLGALAAGAADAAVVLLVDMPGITPAAVRRIVAFAAPDALAMGGYDNRRSHPVLLGRDHWAGVAASATGDRGARDYLRTHAHTVRVVPMDDIADDTDLDIPPGPPEPDTTADDEA